MDTFVPSDTLLAPEGPSRVARSVGGAEADELERDGASGEAMQAAPPPSKEVKPAEGVDPEVVRLPGEPDLSKLGEADPPRGAGGASPSLRADPRPAMAKPARSQTSRANWLAGTAIAAVVAVFGGAFLVSRYNHVMPLPPRVMSDVHHLASQAGLGNKLLAPAATLAKVNVPPQPKAIVRPKYTVPPKSQELAEIVALHSGSETAIAAAAHDEEGASGKKGVRAAAKVVKAPTSTPYTPTEPGMAAAARAASVAAVTKPEAMAAASSSATSPAASAPPGVAKPKRISIAEALEEQASAVPKATVPVAANAAHPSTAIPQPASSLPVAPAAATPAKPDALAVASHLQAAPMTPKSQVKVLQLVMQMAAMLQEQRTAIAELRATVQTSTAELSDFERRLTLLEAAKAVAAAAATPLRIPAAKPISVKQPVQVTHADAVLAVAPQGAKRYRLQAASPGLAMLAEVGRGGGAGAQLQVQVGDTIPGYGRVESISQQGTEWVVVTQHGDIR